MNSQEIIARLKAHEQALRARGVSHAALFGSRARGDDRPNSDTDIMIAFDPAAPIGVWAGVPYDVFKDGNMRLYAAVGCLEIISEASRRLPPETSIVTNAKMLKRASYGTRSPMGFHCCEPSL